MQMRSLCVNRALTVKYKPRQVAGNMTGEDLLEYVVGKALLDRDVFWGLFEVVCNGQLGKDKFTGMAWHGMAWI